MDRNKWGPNQKKYENLINIDIDELTMTKDVTDFDRNFLRYLKISME
jgi:hypothetical protein